MGLRNLAGRTAVITGASRGIGAALAAEFAAHGMQLGLCARGEPALAEGDSVVASRVDVSDEAAVEGFAAAVEQRFGTIDLWINNAGILDPIAPLRDVSAEDFRRHMDINVTGVFFGTRAYVRHLRERSASGVLLNISSGAGRHPYRGWSAYCAGKAAVDRLTEVVALEEAASGLRAHAVAPGVVDTEMQTMIRGCSPDDFPDVENFIEMKQNESFNSGAYVARELLAIAFDPDRTPDEVSIGLDYE